MEEQRELVLTTFVRRVVFAEDPRIAQALEDQAIEHGRGVAAEVRAAMRGHIRREEQPA
jgi:hypothetical protein